MIDKGVTGIILAGGKSSRMGKDKGLIVFEGKPLVEYQIELLEPLCDQIIISANQLGYEAWGYPVIKDNYHNCGPLGGLEATLKKSPTEWSLVVSCDSPFLIPGLFRNMSEMLDNAEVIIPTHRGGLEPMIGFYKSKLATFFETKILQSDFKLQKVLKERKLALFNADHLIKKHPRLFLNLNSPCDLTQS